MKGIIQHFISAALLGSMLLLLSPIASAQSTTSSTTTAADSYDPIIATLDSLVTLHYVQKIQGSTETGFPSSDFQGNEIPAYSNDIYAKRMAKIHTDIPLTFNADVKEYLDLYALKRRALTQRVMGLSALYFPLYEQILDEQGLPLEFKYLSIVESALNPTAVSRMGATGLWQFMLATGRMYDLKVNTLIDERRDPVKSTYAACEYFKDMYAIYNDWLLVIAAYNCGAGNVNKAIVRSGGKKTFWEISPYLPRETRGYVPAFIAVTYLLNYSAEHNLTPVAPELSYFETDTVMVDKKMNLRDIALAIDVPLEQLTYLNPVYKRGIIPDSEEPLMLRMPSSKINSYLANIEQLYEKNEVISAPLIVAVTNTESSDSRGSNLIKRRHHIRSGEHLSSIAGKYSCTVTDLKKWNNLHSNRLKAGNYLTVYVKSQKKMEMKTISANSSKNNNSAKTDNIDKVIASTPKHQNQTSGVAKGTLNNQSSRIVYHVVQPGDTLWEIAKRYDGVTVQQIKDVNRLNSNNLKVGTKLKVPVSG